LPGIEVGSDVHIGSQLTDLARLPGLPIWSRWVDKNGCALMVTQSKRLDHRRRSGHSLMCSRTKLPKPAGYGAMIKRTVVPSGVRDRDRAGARLISGNAGVLVVLAIYVQRRR
jgi:hypothetical protein